MADLLAFLGRFAPFLLLALLLAAMVLAINMLGKRLERHAEWLALIDVRVDNLHKDRKATWARELQRQPTELVPPPLPPRAPTLDAVDWRDESLATEELQKRQTGRYPDGVPPKGSDDDP